MKNKSILVIAGVLLIMVLTACSSNKVTQSNIVGTYDVVDYRGEAMTFQFKKDGTVIIDSGFGKQGMDYSIKDTELRLKESDKDTYVYKIKRDKKIVLTFTKYIDPDGKTTKITKEVLANESSLRDMSKFTLSEK